MPPTPRQPPLVTVHTVTCNRRPLLPLLQACLLAQTYPLQRLEWLILDDSSGGELPDLEPARRAGIQVVWKQLAQRLPVGAKRNLANSLASGELIVVMDDDDYYPPSRIADAVELLLSSGAAVAGCDRMPLLLLPEASRWLSRPYGRDHATANTLAYRRSYVEAGHRFEPQAGRAEEPAFLAGLAGAAPLLQLDPFRTLVCIGHGGNTVDKRTWVAAHQAQGFEHLPAGTSGFPPQAWLADYRAALGLPPAQPEPEPPAAVAAEPHSWRVAVITPYHNEPLELLQRCHASVRAQTVPCVHVLVADGPLRPELASLEGRHIVLGVGHADNGNTPRSIGALAAMNEGFSCIAFLDADNWFSPDHLEQAIATQATGAWDVVFSDRQLVFPHGERLLTPPEEDGDRSHVDTSCMVLFPPAFSSLSLWAEMPPAYAPLCDRVVFAALMARHRCGWSGRATLFFETWYWGHFLAAGLVPPLNAKFLPCREPAEWEEAAAAFRQRSALPQYPGPVGIAPARPRLNLVTIHAGPCAGGPLLQWHLGHHFGFTGIADNQLLWQAAQRLGADPSARHPAPEIAAALAQGLTAAEAPGQRPLERQPLAALASLLRSERHYTLLEAYVRVVVGLTPPQALEFSRAFGQVHVLDASASLPLVAELLFRCLPLHQGLLLLRDPIAQVAAWRRLCRLQPERHQPAEADLLDLLQQVLTRVLEPLRWAPAGQLLLLRYEDLLRQPAAVVLAVSRFLGQEPNPLGATEPLPESAGSGEPIPDRYGEELRARTAVLGEPPLPDDGDGELAGDELALLLAWLAPLRPWWPQWPQPEPVASPLPLALELAVALERWLPVGEEG